MIGFFASILSAVGFAFSNVFVKKLKAAGSPNFATFVQEISLVLVLTVILTLGTIFSFKGGWSWITPHVKFWPFLFIWVMTELAAAYFRNKSVQTSAISTTVPLLLYSTVFVFVLAFIMLGEWPTGVGFLGIACVVFGTLMLGLQPNQNALSSLWKFFGDRGHKYAFLGAFLTSFAIVFTKQSFEYTGGHVLVSAFWVSTGMIVFLAINFMRSWSGKRLGWSNYSFDRKIFLDCLWLGLIAAITNVAHYIALAALPAVYFTTLKRTGVFLSAPLGKRFFCEQKTGVRFLATIPMVFGVVLIGLDTAFQHSALPIFLRFLF